MIEFYYRSTDKDKKKNYSVTKTNLIKLINKQIMNSNHRPNYFNKHSCLMSFVRAVKNLKGHPYKIYFLNDTDISKNKLGIMKKYGEVINLGGKGNGGSMRYIFSKATKSNSKYVYFAEDDYLYKENAFSEMLEAFELLKPDYITLYDHPDRYKGLITDSNRKIKLYLGKNQHWRDCYSTCMTFGARAEVFNRDVEFMKLFTLGVDKKDNFLKKLVKMLINPFLIFCWDQNMWHFLTGSKQFFWKFPKRKLISPITSLATHVSKNNEAPFVNWKLISNKYKKTNL
jgi:hypothetical protein